MGVIAFGFALMVDGCWNGSQMAIVGAVLFGCFTIADRVDTLRETIQARGKVPASPAAPAQTKKPA